MIVCILILVVLCVSFITVMFHVGCPISVTRLCFIEFCHCIYVLMYALIYSAPQMQRCLITYLLTYLLTNIQTGRELNAGRTTGSKFRLAVGANAIDQCLRVDTAHRRPLQVPPRRRRRPPFRSADLKTAIRHQYAIALTSPRIGLLLFLQSFVSQDLPSARRSATHDARSIAQL